MNGNGDENRDCYEKGSVTSRFKERLERVRVDKEVLDNIIIFFTVAPVLPELGSDVGREPQPMQGTFIFNEDGEYGRITRPNGCRRR